MGWEALIFKKKLFTYTKFAIFNSGKGSHFRLILIAIIPIKFKEGSRKRQGPMAQLDQRMAS